jgi:hypothetical protein
MSGTYKHLKRLPGAGADHSTGRRVRWRQSEVKEKSRDSQRRRVDEAACMDIACKQQSAVLSSPSASIAQRALAAHRSRADDHITC